MERNFDTPILACRLNKARIVIALQHSIEILNLSNLSILQSINTTSSYGKNINSPSDDSKSVFALSRENVSYLAYPDPETKGEIILHDTINLKILGKITAHKSDLVQICFNSESNLLATASTTGTVIRLWSLPDGHLLHTFRRGMTHVYINSISFCPASEFLLAGSSSGTVHLFILPSALPSLLRRYPYNPPATPPTGTHEDPPPAPKEVAPSSSIWDFNKVLNLAQKWTASAVSSSTQYILSSGLLPDNAQEYASSSRSICTFRVPSHTAPSTLPSLLSPSAFSPYATTDGSGKDGNGNTGTSSGNYNNNTNGSSSSMFHCAIYRPDVSSDHLKVAVITHRGSLYRFISPPIAELLSHIQGTTTNTATGTTHGTAPTDTSGGEDGLTDWRKMRPVVPHVVTWEDEVDVTEAGKATP